MKFVLLLAVFAVGCFAAPDNRVIINARIRAIIDNIRNDMTSPMLIDRLELNVDSDSLVASGYVENASVTGHNKFIDDVIQFSLVGLRLTFRILVPEILIDGFYDLNGRLMNRFPVVGRGDFHGAVRDIVVDGHCRLAVSDGFLYMREFVPRVQLGAVTTQFDGLVSDQALTNDFINRLIEVIVMDLFNIHQDTISQTVADIAIPIANNVLNNMTIADLLTAESQFDGRPTLY